MGSTTDKIKGYANEAIGNIKQGVGKAIGSEKLQAEGFVQERKGEAQQVVGEGKQVVEDTVDAVKSSSTTDKIKGYANDAAGNLKQVVGRASGNTDLEAEGLAQEAKGETQKGVAAAKKSVER